MQCLLGSARADRQGCRRGGRIVAAALLIAAVAACSSNGGGSPNIVNSQTADSQTLDFGVAYVKRTVPTTQDDLRLRRTYFLKADLYLLNPTTNGGKELNITARITGSGNYDIKDVDVSSDGTHIIFAMRGPLTPGQNDLNPPNWNIWQYVVALDELQPILPTDDPNGTAGQYISPHYLPDGRILFASTRQHESEAVLLDEGKPEFEAQTEDLDESTFDLHVMNADGTGLHQISFNQSHDVDATVLANGRVMWSRWDHANGKNGIHLYTSNPDGTDTQLLYGAGSHNTVTTNPASAATCPAGEACTIHFVRSREMPDGRVLALVRPFTPADFGGDLEIIDVLHYAENNQPFPDNGAYPSSTVAQQPATPNTVLTQVNTAMGVPVISPGGRFSSAFPLWDGTGRVLVTWSECRLQDPTSGTILACTSSNLGNATLQAAPVLYSAWMFNPGDNTFKPLLQPVEGVMLTDIVALQPRPNAPVTLTDIAPVSGFQATGVLDIHSVYDFDGATWSGLNGTSIGTEADTPADSRPARFLRLEKAVSIPNKQTLNFDQASAFGAAGNYMREILGYVPIEPDGSVRVIVPANVAFQVSVVDATAQRIFPLHRAWLQVVPGEVLSCNGCHTPPSSQNTLPGLSSFSHGRNGLFTAAWSGATSTSPFPGTLGSYSPCIGDTMAEVLAGWDCGNLPYEAATLSTNVAFTDPWFGGGPGNESILLSYDDPSFTTPLPTSQVCLQVWTATCRIEIDYPTHIQPLWDKDRGANTCTTCHSGATPAGNLNLADGASATDANQDESYQQLLYPLEVTTTNPSTGQTTQSLARPQEFISGDALDSRFFTFFVTGGAHAGLLSPVELRLLTEWVDIGAQYYNNPFNAPTG